MSNQPEDELPTQAAMEQGQAALVDMAKIYAAYFKELREGGFSRREAFEMTVALQVAQLSGRPPQ